MRWDSIQPKRALDIEFTQRTRDSFQINLRQLKSDQWRL